MKISMSQVTLFPYTENYVEFSNIHCASTMTQVLSGEGIERDKVPEIVDFVIGSWE